MWRKIVLLRVANSILLLILSRSITDNKNIILKIQTKNKKEKKRLNVE